MNKKYLSIMLAFAVMFISAGSAFSLRYKDNTQIAGSSGYGISGGVALQEQVVMVKAYDCNDKVCKQLQEQIISLGHKIDSIDKKVVDLISNVDEKEIQDLYKKVYNLEEEIMNHPGSADLNKKMCQLDSLTFELIDKSAKLNDEIVELYGINVKNTTEFEKQCKAFNEKYGVPKQNIDSMYEDSQQEEEIDETLQ